MRAYRNISWILIILLALWPSLARASFIPFNTNTNLRVGIGTSEPPNQTGLVVMTGNVGIGTWRPAGALDVKTGNNVLVESGNVGIGSLTPGQLLDVQGTVRATGFTAGAGGITLGGVNNTSWPSGGYWVTGNVGINTTNNVGIGSVNPGTLLDVQGTVRDIGEIVNGNVGIGTSFVNGTGEAALTIMNGNVGIGTWTPAGQLDVEGTLSTSIFKGNVGIGTTTPQGSFVVTNGNVGIGTWVPKYALDVETSSVGASGFYANNDITAGVVLQGYYLSETGTWASLSGNVGIGTSIVISNPPGIGQLDVMSGNIGLGTWLPLAELQVNNNANAFVVTSAGNVGIGTWVPNSTMAIIGSQAGAYANVSSNTVLDGTYFIVNVDTTGGVVTITLPTAVGIGGRCYRIKDAGGQAATNNITIASNGGTIDKNTTVVMNIGFQQAEVCSNNTNWLIY